MIKAWKDSREPFYSFIATVAGALVVANVATGLRPFGSLAGVTRSVGLVSTTGWLTADAPAFVNCRRFFAAPVLVAVTWGGVLSGRLRAHLR